jgi:hypothetical protein
MASSVKIKDNTKNELERLQAEILLKTNKKFSQQDLIDILINFGKNHLEELLEITTSKTLTQNDVDEVLALSSAWGIETTPESIDDIIYGEDS